MNSIAIALRRVSYWSASCMDTASSAMARGSWADTLAWRTTAAFNMQKRNMSKYLSKSAKKNIPLTTKRAHKGFYKGKGATKEGRLTSKGKFIVDPLKQLQLAVPDLTNFQLKPYIASNASRFPPEARKNPAAP